jgi:hypothetical protein
VTGKGQSRTFKPQVVDFIALATPISVVTSF